MLNFGIKIINAALFVAMKYKSKKKISSTTVLSPIH